MRFFFIIFHSLLLLTTNGEIPKEVDPDGEINLSTVETKMVTKDSLTVTGKSTATPKNVIVSISSKFFTLNYTINFPETQSISLSETPRVIQSSKSTPSFEESHIKSTPPLVKASSESLASSVEAPVSTASSVEAPSVSTTTTAPVSTTTTTAPSVSTTTAPVSPTTTTAPSVSPTTTTAPSVSPTTTTAPSVSPTTTTTTAPSVSTTTAPSVSTTTTTAPSVVVQTGSGNLNMQNRFHELKSENIHSPAHIAQPKVDVFARVREQAFCETESKTRRTLVLTINKVIYLYSPRYPYYYPSYAICGWNILVPLNYHMKLTCNVMKISRGDYLYINDEEFKYIKPVHINTQIVRILFTSDRRTSGKGFRCEAVAIPNSGYSIEDQTIEDHTEPETRTIPVTENSNKVHPLEEFGIYIGGIFINVDHDNPVVIDEGKINGDKHEKVEVSTESPKIEDISQNNLPDSVVKVKVEVQNIGEEIQNVVDKVQNIVEEFQNVNEENDVTIDMPWDLLQGERTGRFLRDDTLIPCKDSDEYGKIMVILLKMLEPGMRSSKCVDKLGVGVYSPEYVNYNQLLRLYSPDYPKNYKPISDCGWIITTRMFQTLKFRCPVYNLGSGDHIILTDYSRGSSTEHVFDSSKKMEYTSVGDEVLLKFISDAVDDAKGFHCTVLLISNDYDESSLDRQIETLHTLEKSAKKTLKHVKNVDLMRSLKVQATDIKLEEKRIEKVYPHLESCSYLSSTKHSEIGATSSINYYNCQYKIPPGKPITIKGTDFADESSSTSTIRTEVKRTKDFLASLDLIQNTNQKIDVNITPTNALNSLESKKTEDSLGGEYLEHDRLPENNLSEKDGVRSTSKSENSKNLKSSLGN